MSTVYGPAEDEDKPLFLQEMKDLVPSNGELWLIAGDFNMINSGGLQHDQRSKGQKQHEPVSASDGAIQGSN
jgi:hypothetical protein